MDGKDVSAGDGGDGLEQGPVDCGRRVVCAQQLRERGRASRRPETSRGSVRPPAIGRPHGPSTSWTPRCRARSSPMRRGRSQPATMRDPRRRRTPKAATTSSATPRGALSFLGWTTGVPQQAGMWFQIELPAPLVLTEIQFTSSAIGGRSGLPPAWTFPRGYQVQVSADGSTWSAPVAEGQGVPGTTVITFAPVSARFVRITQTASEDNAPAWSMRLLRLFQAPVRPGGPHDDLEPAPFERPEAH